LFYKLTLGHDSHCVKVNYNGEDFLPTENGSETADELVLFETPQFLPCFLIKLKRL
jgi:hypothetical protein